MTDKRLTAAEATRQKKRRFCVTIPIAGVLIVEVEAADAASAEQAAWDAYNESGAECGDVEWGAYEALTTGNVLHAQQNSVEVSEI